MKRIKIRIAILTSVMLISLVLGAVALAKPPLNVNRSDNAKNGNGYVQDEIIIKFKGDEKPFRVIKVPEGKVLEEMGKYKKRSDIEYAEPNYIAHALMVPNDEYYSYQWHLDNSEYNGIGMEEAWNISTGLGVSVAVIDTGIAYENYQPSRREKYYLAPDLAQTCFIPGYDFVNNDSHPNDDDNHGTHVAGTIAQSTNNSIGVAGIAYDACLMPVKVLDKNGNGTYANVANGIIWAADHGAQVINLSLGGSESATYLEEALAYAYNSGVTIVAAAGNDSENFLNYPAAYDDYVIAVGAARYDESLSYYSNYGPSLDLVAPGGDLNVDQNNDGYTDGILQQTFKDSKNLNSWSYYFFQGTSMAAPHVAGVAALVLANGNATAPDEVRSALEEAAEDLGTAGRDDTYGYGLVDAYAALQWTAVPVDSPPTVSITSPADRVVVLGTIAIEATATDDNGVTEVNFYVGEALIGTDTVAPYGVDWDSTTVTDGAYTITVTAIDTVSQTASDSISVSVDNVNNPPIANAGPDQTAYVGNTVIFDGSGSSDPDGTITSYSWDFGDDTTGAGVTTTHVYTAAGIYTVTLIVTDNGGLTAQDTSLVSVTEVPAEIEVFSDNFEAGEWNGLWTEDGQNDWFRSTQRAVDGKYSAEVDGSASDAKLTSIPIDLQGKANATITFSWYIEKGLDSGEYLAFDVSTDGGTIWVEKARLRGNIDSENTWHNVSIDLTGINKLQMRFRAKMSSSNEDANVDLVKVTAR